MKAKITLLLFLVTVLISCSKQTQYSQFEDFGESNRWQKSDTKTFEFEITDDINYNLVFQFSHVYDYQFASVPIHFEIENPDGKKEESTIDLAIKDSNGKQLADCSGDVCDLFYTLKKKTRFPKGKYKITVSQNFEGPFLPNVLGIGISVASVK